MKIHVTDDPDEILDEGDLWDLAQDAMNHELAKIAANGPEAVAKWLVEVGYIPGYEVVEP